MSKVPTKTLLTLGTRLYDDRVIGDLLLADLPNCPRSAPNMIRACASP